jgi:hypothetical protein
MGLTCAINLNNKISNQIQHKNKKSQEVGVESVLEMSYIDVLQFAGGQSNATKEETSSLYILCGYTSRGY